MITTKHITTKQVKAKIEGLKRMSELNPEDYAEKDGWAESIVIDQKSSLNATQLRKIFHYVKLLRCEFKQQGGLDRAKVAMMTPFWLTLQEGSISATTFMTCSLLCSDLPDAKIGKILKVHRTFWKPSWHITSTTIRTIKSRRERKRNGA